MRALYDCAFYRIFSCGRVCSFVFRSKLWQAFATIWPYGEHLSQFGSCSNIYPSPSHLIFSMSKDCATLLSQLFDLLISCMYVHFSSRKSSYKILFFYLRVFQISHTYLWLYVPSFVSTFINSFALTHDTPVNILTCFYKACVHPNFQIQLVS